MPLSPGRCCATTGCRWWSRPVATDEAAGPDGPPGALSDDAFLGGRVRAMQPRKGFRAGIDTVLMAAACPARSGDEVLELGCGAGVAALCLNARVPGLSLVGVERQPDYAALARHNARRAGAALDVGEADLAALPAGLRARSFDHVMANPPFLSRGGGTAALDPGREAALREDTSLDLWLDVAARRLRTGGWLTLIHAAARLPELLEAARPRFREMRLLPVSAREGRAAGRVILRARKGRGEGCVLLAPLVLHAAPSHLRDGEDFTPLAARILRGGALLPL
ncbi:MAG: methyltransferase [Rhodobacteraceae bacterium]|nr:methyltransferase [Paracoccaceae bacterium]